jgi:hypothetical protein
LTKYADGTDVYPSREVAEKVLNEVMIPEQFKQMIKNANDYAKSTVIQGYTPPKADVDLIQMIEDHKEHMEGKK